jgi:hypothetical protein
VKPKRSSSQVKLWTVDHPGRRRFFSRLQVLRRKKERYFVPSKGGARFPPSGGSFCAR